MAAGKKIAADVGAYLCFEDETGQGFSPPKGRTWGRRGQTPVIRVRGGGRGYVSVAGVVCLRPGDRSHLFYRLHVWHGRKSERKSFTWQEYRDLIVLVHRQVGAPVVWVWDNLPVHLTGELTEFIAQNKEWLTVFRLPAYAPDLNPTEGVWSLVKRSLENFAAASLDHLVHVLKRKLKKIQYRPHLLQGCLAETGLIIDTS